MSLKKKILNGIKWTSFSSFVLAVFYMFQLIILARILGPEVYGIMAILTIVISFSNLFVDMGMSKIIIHKQDLITNEQLNTLYWLNILLAVFIYSCLFLASSAIAIFYNNNDLEYLIQLISLTFVIKSFALQYNVILEKELRFKTLEIINMFTAFLNFTISLILALNNFEIYSLIYAVIISSLINTLLLIYFGSNYHKVKFYFNFKEIKEFIPFGLYWTGSKSFGSFAHELDIIIIGKVFDSTTLGIYHIAKQLLSRPMQVIMPVVIKISYPLFGKIQTDLIKSKTYYLNIINLVSLIIVPIYIIIYLLADEFITILFGMQWVESTQITKNLVLYAILTSFSTPIGSLIMARGKANWNFWWNFFLIPYFSIVLVLSYQFGIEFVAIAISIAQVPLVVLSWKFMISKLINISFVEYFKYISLYFTSSILIIILLNTMIYIQNTFLSKIITVISYVILYIIFSLVINKITINKIKGLFSHV